jgi:hypothetical protein
MFCFVLFLPRPFLHVSVWQTLYLRLLLQGENVVQAGERERENESERDGLEIAQIALSQEVGVAKRRNSGRDIKLTVKDTLVSKRKGGKRELFSKPNALLDKAGGQSYSFAFCLLWAARKAVGLQYDINHREHHSNIQHG